MSMLYSIRADWLDANRDMIDVLSHVDGALCTIGLRHFLIGAGARILILEGIYGLAPGRATRDVDFAVAVDGWAQFEAMKMALLGSGRFEVVSRTVQKLQFKHDAGSTSTIDLVPFGKIMNLNQTIAWPPDMKVIMSIAGYDEAFEASIHVKLGGATTRVASLAGLALMKVFAWTDRRHETSKDAQDFMQLLVVYGDAPNSDRLYDHYANVLESLGYDTRLAGARLLGHDIRQMAEEVTLDRLETLLTDPDHRTRLERDMLARSTTGLRREPIVEPTVLIDQLLIGAGLRTRAR